MLNKNRNINKSLIEKIKSNLLLIGLVFITIGFMIFFKINENMQQSYNKGKIYINDFFNKKLKPLYQPNEISNEQVFNLVFLDEMPLSENKLLKFKSDFGKPSIEIEPTGSKLSANYFDVFKNNFIKKKQQKLKIDSLLEVSKPIIAKSIYTKNDSVFAINPELIKIASDLKTKILFYADSQKTARLFLNSRNKNFSELVRNIEFYDSSKDAKQFVVYDGGKFLNKALKRNEKKFSEIPQSEMQFNFKILSNQQSMVLQFGDFDKADIMNQILSNKQGSLILGFNEKEIEFKTKTDSIQSKLNELKKINKQISGAFLGADSWKEFGIRIDSLANVWTKSNKKLDKLIKIKEKNDRIKKKHSKIKRIGRKNHLRSK